MSVVSFDWETYYDPPSGYSLSSMNMSEYILDPRFRALGFALHIDGKPTVWVSEHKVAATLEKLRPQLEACTMLAHNNAFDAAILAWHYDIYCKGYLDTLSMARALGIRQQIQMKRLSLLALCRHFGIGEKPDLRPDSTPEELLVRGSWDAWATMKLFKILVKGYPVKELHAIDLTIKQFINRTIYADEEMLNLFLVEKRNYREQLLAKIGRTEADMQSGGLFADALFQLGIDPPMKLSKTTGHETFAFAKTDEGMKWLLEHDDEAVRELAACRLEIKSTGDVTRAQTFLRLAKHGALPVFYNYAGAHTHRWSGGDGTNFANLKKDGHLRDSIVAPDGCKFVAGDLSQIEARIVACWFGETWLVEAFAQGRDVYAEFATITFNRKHEPVTKKDVFERFSGKTTVLGAGFQCGKKKMWRQMRADVWKYNIPIEPPSREVAGLCVDMYRSMCTNVVSGWARAEKLIHNPGASIGPIVSEGDRLLLPSGQRLFYHGIKWDKWNVVNDDEEVEEKSGYRYDSVRGRAALYGGSITENCVQALARIVMRDAMLDLAKRWNVVMHTYDEIVLCVPESAASDAAADMREVMTRRPEWMPGLPVAVEIGTDWRYGGCK